MTENEWVILFIRKRGRTERKVVIPTVDKLVDWIRKNASSCSEVRIIMREENK